MHPLPPAPLPPGPPTAAEAAIERVCQRVETLVGALEQYTMAMNTLASAVMHLANAIATIEEAPEEAQAPEPAAPKHRYLDDV